MEIPPDVKKVLEERESEFGTGNEKGLFQDWVYSTLPVTAPTENYKIESIIIKKLTLTVKHMIVFYIPLFALSNQDQVDPTYFWTKITPGTEGDTKTLENNIELAYGKDPNRSTKINLNIPFDEIQQNFDQLKPQVTYTNDKNKAPRCCFHFVADNSQSSFPKGIDPMLAALPIKEAIDITAGCGIHIIDCDFSGSLAPIYTELINDIQDHGVNVNFFAFFSCAANERNPRSPGLPADLFSACLNSPGKMALLWHSSHYYCFKQGPLRPIQLDDLSLAPQELINHVDKIFRSAVESMAVQVLSPRAFIQYFHCDDFVARSFCGFVMAQKMFDFFDVHPVSMPALPDFRDSPQWVPLSLRLDEALLRLNSQTTTYSLKSFLEYDVSTIRLLLESDTPIENYAPYLSILHMVLWSPDYAESGCKFLAKYMDKGRSALDEAWLFPLIDPLYSLFEKRTESPYFLLCVAKSMCYAPQCRKNFEPCMKEGFINTYLLPMLTKPQTQIFTVVILALFVKYFKKIDDGDLWRSRVQLLLSTKVTSYLITLLNSPSPDVVNWTLLLISSIAQDIYDTNFLGKLFNVVASKSTAVDPSNRICALYAMKAFIPRGFHSKICSDAVECIDDICTPLRSQLLSLMSAVGMSCKESEREKVDHIAQILMDDPHPEIAEHASSVLRREKGSAVSFVFEHFAEQFLGRNSDLCENHSLSLSQLFEARLPRVERPAQVPYTAVRKQSSYDAGEVLSNMAMTESSDLVFAGRGGSLVSARVLPGASAKPSCIRVSSKQLTHVSIPYPGLVLASDTSGALFALETGPAPKLLTSFRALPADEGGRVRFSVSPFSESLAVFSECSACATLIDLKTSRKVSMLTPSSGPLRSVSLSDSMRDIVLAVGDDAELFDVRESVARPVWAANLKQTAFDGSFAFGGRAAVCHSNAAFSVLDWRLCSKMAVTSLSNDLRATSFALNASGTLAAIGTHKGVVVHDVATDKRVFFSTMTSYIFSEKKPHPVTAVAFHPRRCMCAAAPQDAEVVVLTEVG